MRRRKSEPPAARTDPLDDRGEVARLVVAVAQRARLVAELERAEKDHAPATLGEDPSHRPLRAFEPDEGEGPIRILLDAAAEGRISAIGEAARPLRTELERAAAII